ENMPIVPRPQPPDRDKDLTRLQAAMVIGASGDLPVRAANESGLGQQLAQTHRWNPALGQTVNEPARHRLPPPCFALSPSRPHLGGLNRAAPDRGSRSGG